MGDGDEGGPSGDALRRVRARGSAGGAGLTHALGEGPGFHSWFVTIWLLQAAAGRLRPPYGILPRGHRCR